MVIWLAKYQDLAVGSDHSAQYIEQLNHAFS